MRTHIKAVAVVNILYRALGRLVAVSVLFGGLFGGLFSGSIGTFLAVGVGSVLASIVLGFFSVLGLIAGLGLLNHRQWARYLMIVVSGFRLFKWPFGTLFGGYSLWVLLHSETKSIFETGTP